MLWAVVFIGRHQIEIRNTKRNNSNTRTRAREHFRCTKYSTRKILKQPSVSTHFYDLVIGVCFGFRHSNFGFSPLFHPCHPSDPRFKTFRCGCAAPDNSRFRPLRDSYFVLENRIVTPKFIVTWKEPWVHPIDLFLVFFSFLLGHAQEGIVQEVSYALLNVGRLPVENLEIEVDTIHHGKSQIAAVYD